MEPRELALREVRESPWPQQRELAARLAEDTGLAESTLIRLFRRMEAEGELQSGLDGRRKTYAPAEPVAEPEPEPEPVEPKREPTPGALWSSRLQRLGVREPARAEPEPEPEPVASEPEPEPEPPAPPAYTRPAWPFVLVVAVVVVIALLAALLLSHDKRDPVTGAERKQETITRALRAGTTVTCRSRACSSSGEGARSRTRRNTSRSTMRISICANEAPRLRRTPPLN